MIAAAGIEELLFQVVDALRYPVLGAIALAVVITLFDLGAFFVEIARRNSRDAKELEQASGAARSALSQNNPGAATEALHGGCVSSTKASGAT